MKITVLGSGGWGTALALLLIDNGHEVTLWSHSAAKAEEMRRSRRNPLLPERALSEALAVTGDIACAAGAELVVFATPSFAVRATARLAAPYLAEGTLLVTVSKGIEKETHLRMSQIIAEETGGRFPIVALSGPSHAEEVARGLPTGCVAACADRVAAERVQDAFMSSRFRVYTSPDIVGVEICGAMKNVVALCCGISDGMGYEDNTKALIMTRAMSEMARLGEALGGTTLTFAGLAGMGDMIVTCTSMHSRNRRAGILIGGGKSVQAAMTEIGAVVEGYYAAESACSLARRLGLEMPICQAVYAVLYQGADPREMVGALMNREKKQETSWI
ncbi:MAG: NAD(P)H-dependent glycerol-3-phosphate dehydrogenase [Oscillospiraceae bacterium]